MNRVEIQQIRRQLTHVALLKPNYSGEYIAVAHLSNPGIFLVRSRRVLEIYSVVDLIITWSFFRREVLTT